MEWIETASVMVSTNPELPPVMRMRKLQNHRKIYEFEDDSSYVLLDPTRALFFCPNVLKLAD
jgi:hypothetical protein